PYELAEAGQRLDAVVPGRDQALIASDQTPCSGRQRHPAGEPAGGTLGLACGTKDLPFQAIETARGREKPETFRVAHDDARRLGENLDNVGVRHGSGLKINSGLT